MSIQTERPLIETFPVLPEEGDVTRLLRWGKQLISDPESWVKGFYSDGFGRMCALGAVGKAAKEEGLMKAVSRITAYDYLDQAANESGVSCPCDDEDCKLYDGKLNIALYNDMKETTHEDIMSAFDRAIEIALKEGA